MDPAARIRELVRQATELLIEASRLAPDDETYHVAHVTKKERPPLVLDDADLAAIFGGEDE